MTRIIIVNFIDFCYVNTIFAVLSEKDDSISQRLQESIRESKCFLDEQRSMSFNRFKRRMDDISISNNSSSGKTGIHFVLFLFTHVAEVLS